MTTPKRLLLPLLLAISMTACTLPGAVSPTPFTFPTFTPNLTHTAIFASTPEETMQPPAITADVTQAETAPTSDQGTTGTVTVPVVTPISTATSTAHGSRPNGDPITASYLSTLPTIDGDLSDWTTAPYSANQTVPKAGENWTGASDLSGTFYLGWDANNLYLAVRRTDDTFAQVSWGRYMYRGDDVEIQLDTDLAGDYSSTVMSGDDYQIGLSPGNFGSLNPEAYRWYPRYLESWLYAVDVAAKLTDEGYNLEAKIPWSVFNVTPTSGSRFGFALSLSDNDLVGVSTWQSMVSNVATRLLSDPTTWGTLILEGSSGS
jgi:hypothetical protein